MKLAVGERNVATNLEFSGCVKEYYFSKNPLMRSRATYQCTRL